MFSIIDPKAKLTVYRGWEDPGRYVWSPFVIKLETRLRIAGIPYKVECGSTKASPRGKIPYIDCHELKPDNEDRPALLSDSTIIVKQLIKWGTVSDLNAKLAPELAAHDLALRSLFEDKLIFYHTWERWIMNYYVMRDHILGAIPYPMRVVIGYMIYRSQIKTLYGQGTGRFSPEEIAAFRQDIWESINSLLMSSKERHQGGEKPFWILGGNKPTEADTTAYSFITSVLVSTAAPDSQKVVKSFPAIIEYARRIHDKYFPDYEKVA